jgi:hypothetical protein
MNRYLLIAMVFVAFLPAPSFAEASLVAQSPGHCDEVSSTVIAQLRTIESTRDSQLAALVTANRRLQGLIGQVDAQNHTLPRLQSLQLELAKRTTTLRQSYVELTDAVSVVTNQCGSPASKASARAKLASVRMQIESLQQWYASSLAPAVANPIEGQL